MGIFESINKARMGTGRAYGKTLQFMRCFGIGRGLQLFVLGEVMPSTQRWKQKVGIPGSVLHLYVRPGTSDVTLFNDIYHGLYEWDFAVAPDVIVEAGAYIGLSTTYLARKYPNARIIAIEPDEDNYELLVRNTAWNENISTIHAALWTESGSVSLGDPGKGDWALRVSEADVTGEVDQSELSRVPAVTIPEVMRTYQLDKIDLLKLDIEGSEKEIFETSQPWIDCVDAISVELHDRFKPGCARAFYQAIGEFPIEFRHKDNDVLVLRDMSKLGYEYA